MHCCIHYGSEVCRKTFGDESGDWDVHGLSVVSNSQFVAVASQLDAEKYVIHLVALDGNQLVIEWLQPLLYVM
jgi:hypothetical protein